MNKIGPLEIGEKKLARFDFASEVAPDAVLTIIGVVCTLLEGVDANPSNVLWGTATVQGLEVLQPIQPGIARCTYKLRATVQDDQGFRHVVSAELAVSAG